MNGRARQMAAIGLLAVWTATCTAQQPTTAPASRSPFSFWSRGKSAGRPNEPKSAVPNAGAAQPAISRSAAKLIAPTPDTSPVIAAVVREQSAPGPDDQKVVPAVGVIAEPRPRARILSVKAVPAPAAPQPMQSAPPWTALAEPTARARRALQVLSEPTPAVERCRVADELDAGDLNSSPEIVRKLVSGARQLCSVEERLAFLRALVRGRATRPEVAELFQHLTSDAAPAIRAEATVGLSRLRSPDALRESP